MPARLIFVYGTLLRGERAHSLLAGAGFRGEARTEEGYALIDLGSYPGLVRADGGRVVGEIYEVDAERLAEIDAYEGHPDLFRRVALSLSGRGPISRAEGYLYAGEFADGIPVVGGDWRRRLPRSGSKPSGRRGTC